MNIVLPELIRERQCLLRQANNIISTKSKSLLDFSSSDYLGLNQHLKIKNAISNALKKYGLGSCASALISGYSPLHQEVEMKFANWMGFEKALLFNSGYHANLSIFQALASRSDTILSDKLCHASILDGIRLSRANHIRYQHLDLESICHHLNQKPKFLVTESVFSMEGSTAPIDKIVQLTHTTETKLIIDDAHGIGILGTTGKGIMEKFALKPAQINCLILPLGKAFNASGAVALGNTKTIDTLLQSSRGYHYSTNLSPIICAGILAALDLIQTEHSRMRQLKQNIAYFKHTALQKGLRTCCDAESAIQPILINSNKKVIALQQYLINEGFLVSAIRPPTVPTGTARLRISLNNNHTEAQINKLVKAIDAGLRLC